ncbi:MAG: sodium:solute symporter family protein [Spirochaetales bacterium]|nr:sodium:solute symporter family protein [Spirochaetales bacterium]
MEGAIALSILGLFMFIPLVMGGIANKKSLPTTEDFFVQGRAMGSLAVFFTVAATWWSSFAFLGAPSYFYTRGPVYWTAIAWNILFGVLYYVIGKRIWFYGKKNNLITPSDFFRKLYGSGPLATIVGVIMLLFTLPYLQIQLTGGAYLIEVASGGLIPWKVGGLFFYAIIVIYVWAGGLRAVAWTDIFYGVLLFFGMIFGGFFIAAKVGGTSELFKVLRATAPESLTLPGPQGVHGYGLWISMFIMVPIGAFMGPQLWTRMYSVKSSKLFNLMPFLLGFAAIAYVGSMLLGNTGMVLEAGGVDRPDRILPIMLFKYAPFALASLVCAGGAAAAMSSANSQIHSMSAVYTVDFHQRFINKNMDQKGLVWVGRIAILVFALIAYFMSVFIPGLLVNVGLVALSGTAQVFVPTAGILFWKKSTSSGAIAGLLTGVILLCIFTFTPLSVPFGLHSGLFCIIINTIVFLIVSLVTKQRDSEIIAAQEEQKEIYDKAY